MPSKECSKEFFGCSGVDNPKKVYGNIEGISEKNEMFVRNFIFFVAV
jgi:hypothetical protein